MRVGILGMGSIGCRHAANVKALGHEVIAYDYSIQVQEAIKRDYAMCVTLRDVWTTKPQAVLICTLPSSHLELAYEAFRHGCHTFIEKPLGLSLDGWKELGREFDRAELVDMVACNWRWHEGLLRLKKARELGFPHNPRSLTIWHYSYLPGWVKGRNWREHYSASKEQGGVLFEAAWHLVDLAVWMFGSAHVEEAFLEPSTPLGLDCDGYAGLTLRHTAKRKTIIETDWRYKQRSMAVIVEGERAEKIAWYLRDSKDYDDNEMYKAEIAEFLGCCSLRVPSPNPINSAVKTLQILLEAKTWEQQQLSSQRD